MKKYFIFAAIAAAGLLTSCSSDDKIASEVGPNPIEGENLVPIQIGLGQTASVDVARGTGSVGDLATETTKNIWDAERINVFMFWKGSFKQAGMYNRIVDGDDVSYEATGNEALYDNTEMRTPKSTEDFDGTAGDGTSYGIAQEYETENDLTYVKHKYYPPQGNFDFWGYHGDDATSTPQYEENDIKVPFTINGTQDLMTAVAWPVASGTGEGAKWKSSARTGATESTMSASSTDFYSAKAARAQLQPELMFRHLLTRLEFEVKAGNRRAAGLDPSGSGTDLEGDIYNGVFIRDIKIYSRETGKFLAAYNYWTDEENEDPVGKPAREPEDIVTWDYDTTDGTAINATTGPKVTAAYVSGMNSEKVVPFNVASSEKYTDNQVADVFYTEAEANTHNALLTDALPNDNTAVTAAKAAKYNATLDGALLDADVAYNFAAFVDDDEATTYSGIVKKLETQSIAEYTVVEVVKNEVASFVGKKYAVHATNIDNVTGSLKLYELNEAGDGISDTDTHLNVKDLAATTAEQKAAFNATLDGAIALTGSPTVTAVVANTYNATLPGHKTTSDVKIPKHKIGDVKPLYDVAIYGPVAAGVVDAPYKAAWEAALATNAITNKVTEASTKKLVWYPSAIYDGTNPDADGTPVGEPIMVSPEKGYRIVVTLGEYLKDLTVPNPDRTDATDKPKAGADKSAVIFTTLNPIDITTTTNNGTENVQGFLPEYSYKVRITAYNAQEIVITTSLAGWKTGTNQTVDLE